MKGTKFRVKPNTVHDKGLAGYKYGGMVGTMRHHTTRECKKLTGYPYSLIFEDGRIDGFFKDELEEIK